MERRYALGLAVVTALVYGNTLANGFTFDDHWIAGRPPATLGEALTRPYWGDRGSGLYRPWTQLTFWLEARLWGGEPWGYHLVNLLLHVGVSLAVLRLGSAFLAPRPARAAAWLFALHPVHTEAVAGVVGRAELLAALGVLGALGLALRGAGGRSGLLLVLGLGAKEHAVAYPALLAVLAWARAGSLGAAWREYRRPWLLGVALCGAYLLVRLAVLGAGALPGGLQVDLLDNPLARAPFLVRAVNALVLLGRALFLLLWPVSLAADYSYPAIRALPPTAPACLAAVAGAAAAAAALVWAWRRRFPAAWGGAFLLAAALPTANLLFPVGTAFAERLLYLPSVGFAWAVGALLARVPRRTAVTAALVLLCGGYALRTVTRNAEWRDDLRLFRAAVRTVPRSARAHLNLGLALWQRGADAAAAAAMRRALHLHPGYHRARVKLAALLRETGRPREAWAVLRPALAAAPSLPELHLVAGNVATDLGDLAAAAAHFRRLLALRPESADGHFNLANTLRRCGDAAGALRHYRRALALAPAHPGAWTNLLDTLLGLGRRREVARLVPAAVAAWRRAGGRDPRWAAFAVLMGYWEREQGRPSAAVRWLRWALRRDPGLRPARALLDELERPGL